MVDCCRLTCGIRVDQPTIEFAKKLVEEARAETGSRPQAQRATTTEICMEHRTPEYGDELTFALAELISLGNAQLKIPTARITQKNLLQARHYFSKALHYLHNDPSTAPKQVARVCQKLLEAALGLSQISRAPEERKEHADQAKKYGETALENVVKSGDECMAAQVEFLLACVTAWKVYLLLKSHGSEQGGNVDTESVQTLLLKRKEKLQEYPQLDAAWYEEQARTYTRYLTGV